MPRAAIGIARGSLRFRLSDEKEWSKEFLARSPKDLQDGVGIAWETWIEERYPEYAGVSPELALASRLEEISEWLFVRMNRHRVTEEQSRSWLAQADYRRFEARRNLGGDVRVSPLYLHTKVPSGYWTAPAVRHAGESHPAVPGLSLREAKRLLNAAERSVTHDLRLSSLVGRTSLTLDRLPRTSKNPPR